MIHPVDKKPFLHDHSYQGERGLLGRRVIRTKAEIICKHTCTACQYGAASATGVVATEHPGPRKIILCGGVLTNSSIASIPAPLSHWKGKVSHFKQLSVILIPCRKVHKGPLNLLNLTKTRQNGYLGIPPNEFKLVIRQDVGIVVHVIKRHFQHWDKSRGAPCPIYNVYSEKPTNEEINFRFDAITIYWGSCQKAGEDERVVRCHHVLPSHILVRL